MARKWGSGVASWALMELCRTKVSCFVLRSAWVVFTGKKSDSLQHKVYATGGSDMQNSVQISSLAFGLAEAKGLAGPGKVVFASSFCR